MQKTVLVPMDLVDGTPDILETAIAFARAHQAEIVLLSVLVMSGGIDDPTPSMEDPDDFLRPIGEIKDEQARIELEALCAQVQQAGLSARLQVRSGRPATVILETAKQLSAWMIVMGTHGRGGLRRLWAGSVAEEVLRSAPCPVTIVPVHHP